MQLWATAITFKAWFLAFEPHFIFSKETAYSVEVAQALPRDHVNQKPRPNMVLTRFALGSLGRPVFSNIF